MLSSFFSSSTKFDLIYLYGQRHDTYGEGPEGIDDIFGEGHMYCMGALKMQDWILADQIAGLENAGLENAGLKSDELRLKQPQTSSTVDVSELSQNCV